MPAYITPAEMDAELERLGLTYSGNPSTQQKEQAIARGQIVIDGMRWPGVKAQGRDQVDEWPRSYAEDRDGYPIDPLTVPREIKTATALLGIVEQNNPGTLTPSVTLNDLVKQERVGQLSVTYRDAPSAIGAQPIITRVQAVLRPLTGGNALTLTRA